MDQPGSGRGSVVAAALGLVLLLVASPRVARAEDSGTEVLQGDAVVQFKGHVVTPSGSPAADAVVILVQVGGEQVLTLTEGRTDEVGAFNLTIARSRLPVLAVDRSLIATSPSSGVGVVDRPWPDEPIRIELLDAIDTLTVRLPADQPAREVDTRLVLVRTGWTQETKDVPRGVEFPVTLPAGAHSIEARLPWGTYGLKPIEEKDGSWWYAESAFLWGRTAELVVRHFQVQVMDLVVRAAGGGAPVPGAQVSIASARAVRADEQGRAPLFKYMLPDELEQPGRQVTIEVTHPQFRSREVTIDMGVWRDKEEIIVELELQEPGDGVPVRVVSPTGEDVRGSRFVSREGTAAVRELPAWPSARAEVTDVVFVDGSGFRPGRVQSLKGTNVTRLPVPPRVPRMVRRGARAS